MKVSFLDRMLLPERHHQRLAKSGGESLTVPALSELKVDADVEPLLVTNMRGTFVPTKRSMGGIARYGFSEVSIEAEGTIVNELHRVLLLQATTLGWPNRCKTPLEGIARLKGLGFEPKFVVVSSEDVCGSQSEADTMDRLTLFQGHVAEMEDVQVLVGDLPKGKAFVTAAPALVGVYTRVGDHV